MVDDFSINSELRANDFIEVSWQVFCFGHNFTDFLYDREVRQGKVPDLGRIYLCMSVEGPNSPSFFCLSGIFIVMLN